jgi:transcriptional regulator with XRE-family HTH domain
MGSLRRYQQLGTMLRELRMRRGLTQEEGVKAIAAALESIYPDYDERTLRRHERGENRPPRSALILMVVKAYKQTDPAIVNRILSVADYDALIPEEMSRYGLSQDLLRVTNSPWLPEPQRSPVPQETLWGPNFDMPPGIYIANSATGESVPFNKLKQEIEKKLFNQLGEHIPPKCTAGLGDWNGRPNWLTTIIDPDGTKVGEVWFGTDADNNWAYDGLVRVGVALSDDEAIVWQVFQRYSDGSYRRIRKQAPRLQRTAGIPVPKPPVNRGYSRATCSI